MEFLDLGLELLDNGTVEMIALAVGLPAVASGAAVIREVRKTQKMKEKLLG